MNRFQYPVMLTPAEQGGYVVTCRDLPQLVTQGDTEQDALEQAADAMDEVFAACSTRITAPSCRPSLRLSAHSARGW